MAVAIEIEIQSPVSVDALYELRDLLKQESVRLSHVQLKTKPPLPGQMADGLPDSIISAVVEGVVSVAVEQFYTKVWEPQIAPLLAKWVKGRSFQQTRNGDPDATLPVVAVFLSDGHSRCYFSVDGRGKKHTVKQVSFSINPRKTYAVLVGCSEYLHDLAGIPPVNKNLEDIYALLSDKDCVGLPPENIVTACNYTADAIKHLLYTMSRKEGVDTLIIYFAGHGYRAGVKELYLLASNSKKLHDTHFLDAIEYDFIKEQVLKGAVARQKIMVLDACHSGLATLSPDNHLFEVEGTYILASSQGHEVSYFNPTDRNTYFTAAIIEVLKKGIDRTREKISLDDLYERSKQLLINRKFPAPIQQKGLNIHTHDYFLAPNPAFSLDSLKAAVRNIYADGRHEEALYEVELLIKRFPLDGELREMKLIYTSDILYARLVDEGNELFYSKKDYAQALDKYNKAVSLKDISAAIRANIRICGEALTATEDNISRTTAAIHPSGAPANEVNGRRNKAWALLSFMIFLTIAGVVTAFFVARHEETFAFIVKVKTKDGASFNTRLVALRMVDKKELRWREDTASLNALGEADFELPAHLSNRTARFVLLGDWAKEYEIARLDQDVVMKPNTVAEVILIRKTTGAGKDSSLHTPPDHNSSGRDNTSMVIPAELENSMFDSLASSNNLRLYGINKKACQIQGRLCGYEISGKVLFNGKAFLVISGDVSGNFTLSEDHTRIFGTLHIKESGTPCPLTLTRR